MNAKEWKLGLSSCCTGKFDEDTFSRYADNGIEYMELSPKQYEYGLVNFKEIKKLSSVTGVGIWSFHLQFAPFEKINIAAKDSAVRKSTISYQSDMIKKAGDIGIGITVIHPSTEPNAPEDREELLDIAADSLAQLAQTAAKAGVTIAVEDLPRTCLGNCSSDIKKLISYDDRLRVCFDTNHLLSEKNTDFIDALGDKIVTLHVSDYDFLNERHWLPYEGKNDWVDIVTHLENAGYKGPLMYEIGFRTPDSITRRDLDFPDFKENFTALTEKKLFTPFGAPNDEVCMEKAYFKTPQF